MKTSIFKILFLVFSTVMVLNASTMYMITKLPKVYLVVENFSTTLPMEAKAEMKEELQATADELGIDTTGYSHRTFGVILYDTMIDSKTYLTIELVLGEEVKRLDDGEEVYGITYQKIKHLSTQNKSKENLQEEAIEAVELLVYDFKGQYIEDNK